MNALTRLDIPVAAGSTCQIIDGFGVNINAKYWAGGKLQPLVDRLVDDLGARLFRVDIFGKSNWVDPQDTGDASLLNPGTWEQVYTSEVFQNGWGLMRHLNQRGIEPYLTASGDVPRWMLAADGKTLADYESFCELLVSMVEWAKRREKLSFRLFGPLNETDLGSPEGPTVNPAEFVRVCELLDEKLKQQEMDDIRLVVAENAGFGTAYVQELAKSERLRNRIGVYGLHIYSDPSAAEIRAVSALVPGDKHLWLTEFGDLDQTGEKEWFVAWNTTRRLLDALKGGFQGGLVWDAFDNYHDHDESWTIYGILRTGLRAFTPKKRYHALKQIYRFILPGFQRLSVENLPDGFKLLAFTSPERSRVTLVGMNPGWRAVNLNAVLRDFSPALMAGELAYYRTSETEDCTRVASIPAAGRNWPFTGVDVIVPPESIFTLTNMD